MAKFDTSTIQGYETMDAEQRLAAILAADIPDKVDLTQYVSKTTADKYATEAADLKKQLRAKQTDEEAAKSKAEADQKELLDKYNELLRKTTVSEHTAKFLALGFDERLAAETAEAIVDGNIDKFFTNTEKYKADLEKKIKADLLRGTPRPEDGAAPKPMTRDEISKIKDPTQRQAAIAANMNLYRKEG